MNRTAREPGLLGPALWRLALAGGLFIIVYGGCTQITAARHDVGTWMWDWERHIPFVKEMIIPYWSMDLFFCGAFFICTSRVELNLLTKRLVTVVLLTGVCFLLFPLKLGLPRPEPAGWTAPFFRALYVNDKLSNLAPSLHISLRSLVWVFYGAHLTGWLRKLTKVWFMLIGLSTLLLWQHHVIDVMTGFLMGWVVTSLVPDPRQSGTRNPSEKLAIRYGAGALLCAALAFLWFGFAWPAVSLTIVSLAYATGLSRLLGKENGTLSPSAEWSLLPVIVVTGLIQRKWMKGQPVWHEVTPGVFFGRKPTAREAADMVAEDDLAVLDLTAEANAPTAFREHSRYFNLPLLDLVAPRPEDITQGLDFIRENQKQGRVFIHCKLGLQRSATLAAHWLVDSGAAENPDAAKSALRELDPRVVL